MSFTSPQLDWDLFIEPAVVRHLTENRQKKPNAPEVGGQLFGSFEKFCVRVSLASGPREADKKSRFSFFPSRRKENTEIKDRFRDGLHYVGDWHTHPEPYPTPSRIDLRSMEDCFQNSRHSLSHFVMIIVGQANLPAGLWVSLHDSKSYFQLRTKESGVSGANAIPNVGHRHREPRFKPTD